MARLFAGIAALLLATVLGQGAAQADTVRIFAAGSLRDAFTQALAAFQAPSGAVAAPVFGPSGVLRQQIEHGANVDVFASADMAQPRAVAKQRPVILFARNRLCALGRTKLGLTSDNLLDRLLDPGIRLATSTPGADPGGDYAWAMFDRADQAHPGAGRILREKALKLVGGRDTPPLVPGHDAVSGVFLADRADVMLGYCSGSAAVMRDVPDLASVPLPPALSVGAAYGMVVLSEQPLALRFALFIMSEQGQSILYRNGFDAAGVATP